MSGATQILLQNTPTILSQYGRALLSKGQKGKIERLPNVSIWQTGVRPNVKKVAAYAKVCGFTFDNEKLPLTYPHMLAFPLHMELMLRKDFPLALMGLVHIRNNITQHRAIRLDDKLDICCKFSNLTETEKGLEFDIHTEISSAGILLWESTSTNFARKGGSSSKSNAPRPEPTPFTQQEQWKLASNLGRRYALVSGDSNPIHLFSFSAKLFGFKGHIAHGMWSKARAAATLHPLMNSDSCELKCEFKLPIFLPSTINLNWNDIATTASHTDFELRNKDGNKTHMKGSIRAL